MKINLLHFGSNSTDYQQIYQHEINKIKQFKCDINIIKLTESKEINLKKKKENDTRVIIGKIPKNSEIIIFSERGENVDSIEFSKYLDKSNITFVVGGAEGIDEDLIRKEKPISKFISFGRITYNHKIFKLIVLEQIYRGLSIKNNRKYHRGD